MGNGRGVSKVGSVRYGPLLNRGSTRMGRWPGVWDPKRRGDGCARPATCCDDHRCNGHRIARRLSHLVDRHRIAPSPWPDAVAASIYSPGLRRIDDRHRHRPTGQGQRQRSSGAHKPSPWGRIVNGGSGSGSAASAQLARRRHRARRLGIASPSSPSRL